MKTQSIVKHKYVAEFWNFTEKEVDFIDADGEPNRQIERTHYFAKKINLTVGTDTLSRLKIFAYEPLPVFSQLKNIEDISGNIILKNGVWQITTTESVLSALGIVEGYRMYGQLIQGV
jgi:hypothetical protein